MQSIFTTRDLDEIEKRDAHWGSDESHEIAYQGNSVFPVWKSGNPGSFQYIFCASWCQPVVPLWPAIHYMWQVFNRKYCSNICIRLMWRGMKSATNLTIVRQRFVSIDSTNDFLIFELFEECYNIHFRNWRKLTKSNLHCDAFNGFNFTHFKDFSRHKIATFHLS